MERAWEAATETGRPKAERASQSPIDLFLSHSGLGKSRGADPAIEACLFAQI